VTGLASARFRPANRIVSPTAAVTPKIATIGTRSSGLAAPIAVEITAPVPSWKNPSRADALPAFRVNGAMASSTAAAISRHFW
jgi:hypothetical protein